MAIKRRDLLDASRLLARHKMVQPGELDQTALMLAVQYLQAKREKTTDLSFPDWLDQEMETDDDDDDADEGEEDPTSDPS